MPLLANCSYWTLILRDAYHNDYKSPTKSRNLNPLEREYVMLWASLVKPANVMLILLRLFNGPYSRYPQLYTHLRDWWDKNKVTRFLRGQTSEKNCQSKKLRSSLYILDNIKWRTFHLKDGNGKLWELIIVTFLDAVATVDVLAANNNDVVLSKFELYNLHDY